MTEIKIVQYEDKENESNICFLNPTSDIKTDLINQCSNNFLNFAAIKKLIEFLESNNINTLKKQSHALIVNSRRFECFSV